MEEKITRKQIIPLVIGVLTLVILVASATYAYFSVTSGRLAGTTTITGDIGGDTLGTVTLSGGNTNLYLGLSAYDMSETKKGTTYYSSLTEGSRETSLANAGKTTYTAELTGDNTLTYACDYEFSVSTSGTAIGQESLKDVEVIFEGDIEEALELTSANQTVSGTWYGIKGSDATRTFNAYLQLTNTTSVQNDIAGTNLSVEITNTNWNCYLSEAEELKGEAYALVVDEGDRYTLIFVRSETPITVNDTYEGKPLYGVYTGFEEETYDMGAVPWDEDFYKEEYGLTSVVFKDIIRPQSTANWFYMMFRHDTMWLTEFDLKNLDTSLVTNMSAMFMSQSFDKVTGIEDLDVSNVTNMSNMFTGARINASLDLSGWNVSNVTNMSMMFAYATLNVDLNLSGWNVNITEPANFSTNISGTGTLTQPIWPTT